jgi:hypothetical protein
MPGIAWSGFESNVVIEAVVGAKVGVGICHKSRDIVNGRGDSGKTGGNRKLRESRGQAHGGKGFGKLIIKDSGALSLRGGGSEDEPFSKGGGGRSTFDAMDEVEIKEEIAKRRAAEIGFIHLINRNAGDRDSTVGGELFVMGGNKGTELKDKFWLLGRGAGNEFAKIAGGMTREFHKVVFDEVTIIKRTFDGEGTGVGGGGAFVGRVGKV